MASSTRQAIPEPVEKRLYALSGNRCAFPKCGAPVTEQITLGEPPSNLGEVAHIVAAGRQGPRADPAFSPENINAIENLMVLCKPHHKRVDDHPRIYTPEVLAKYKADHEANIAGVDVPPAPLALSTETVDLTVLPITRLPETVYSARPEHRTTAEIAEHLVHPRGDEVLPFVLHRGRIFTFHDLTAPKGPFRNLIDPDTIEVTPSAALFSQSDRRVLYVWLLNSSLGRLLIRRGVRFDRDHRRYFFLADHETVTRTVTYTTKTGRKLPREVVRQEGARTTPRPRWWHVAAQLRFEEFTPGAWGLTIRPEFHITTDGREPLDPRRVGARVTRKKSHMYNEAYFDAVHFWRKFLVADDPRLIIKAGGQSIIIDGELCATDATWPVIGGKTFEPAALPEDDLLTLLEEQLALSDDEWGAEYEEEDG
jgi:hypothetical protein